MAAKRKRRRRNPAVSRRGSYRGDYFRVSVTAAEVEDFADTWPGSGMHDRDGFAAEFNADTGDLVDLEGWPSTDEAREVDQSALSALIDDMRNFGMRGRKKGQFWEDKPAGYRKRNPATRGRKRRRITSKAQFRRLAAMATRGEISRRDFRDMVAASRPYASLPARKGAARKRRKSRRQSRRRGRR